ncbi:MAG: class I SAM-dependent methyltransferase [Steroidobacteraceae bacterium]|nr:class I SAM-dependent methyltransferase [Steroidobacteraceae bacterium]
MRRDWDGLLPRTARLADESYLDFVTSFRARAVQQMYPMLEELGNAVVGREHPAGTAPGIAEIQRSLDALPLVRVWQRFMRSHQEMMWRRTRASIAAEADQWLAAMRDAEARGPGRLLYDPAFVVPDYARVEVHLQPGGYTDDPLGGPVFHYGTHVFYQGENAQDEQHVEMARKAAAPRDGAVRRVLDLACSIGQATVALKQRFPAAETWGIDVALPLLRYAHLRAAERGVDVNFQQALAEQMPFPDRHFDLVLSYILFHEIPWRITERVVPEVARVMRPGGTFCIYEFPNASGSLSPVAQFLIDYDSHDNCEPYSREFVRADFHGLLRDSGFDVAPGPKVANGFLQSIVATRR